MQPYAVSPQPLPSKQTTVLQENAYTPKKEYSNPVISSPLAFTPAKTVALTVSVLGIGVFLGYVIGLLFS